MPAKYKLKQYRPGGVYYIYNRAAEGRNIFEDDVDYRFWEGLMARYAGRLGEETESRFKAERPYRRRRKQEMNLEGKVSFLAYSLLRRSVYLLIRQEEADGITKLMRRLLTTYTMYLNRRHNQRGHLFAGVYRGVWVSSGRDWAYLSRRIHRAPAGKIVRRFGPVETVSGEDPEEYLYSSYGNYLKKEKNDWLDPNGVLTEFDRWAGGRWKSYREFVDEAETIVEEWMKSSGGRAEELPY